VYNCTFSANTGIVGAGIYNYAGTLTVNNCTFSGNIAVIGGGIFNTIGGTVRMNNCTLSGNAANGDGGGIYNDKYNSSVTLLNTIIAGNTSPSGPDVYGAVTSQGHNLVGNSTGSSGWVGSDLLNVNPLLGPLQDNGGPTFTMAPSLSPISAAIDAGDDAVTGAPLNLTSDQRGRPRKSGAHVDIGAVEISPITLVVSNNNDSGSGSLRQTILDAFPYEGDTITFAPNVTGTITLSSGELLLTRISTSTAPARQTSRSAATARAGFLTLQMSPSTSPASPFAMAGYQVVPLAGHSPAGKIKAVGFLTMVIWV
jgi:hypothetical protein